MNYKISLSSVRIPREAYALMQQTLEEEKVGQSEYVEKFEQMICEYAGARYCIAVSNGTMADAVAVAALKETLGIRRVVVPALTFIAQPNSVRYNNLEVVFADVQEDWLLDLEKCFKSNAPDDDTLIFFTDLMGRTPDVDLQGGMPVIEDACEAFGSQRAGRHAGTFGLMGTYSFFPSHTISTGEGGAVVTDDVQLAQLCRSLRAHGGGSMEAEDKFTFPRLGFNARMTSMQAVLGIAVMTHLPEYITQRRMIFAMMQAYLGGFDEKVAEQVIPHGYPIEFKSEELRNAGMRKILDAGIECRKFFSCIPLDEIPYRQEGEFPVAAHISHTHLYLPCHQNMNADDVIYIAEILDGLKGRV